MAEYKGTIELIGGLTPKNNGNFPLASAKDIQVDDTGKRLDEKLAELEQGGGSGEPGADGITPHIGENGHWFIGDEDTGVKAQGEDGAYPTDLVEMGGDATKTTYRLEFSNGTGYDFDVYHGADGTNGQSAYELWLAEGNTGSVDDFLDSLKGADGTTQVTPLDAESVEWLNENGDTTKLYLLPDGFIYHYAEVETEVESGGGYTNILPLAVNADGTEYVGLNGEDGYKTDYRLNSSKAEVAQAGMCCTGFMPIDPSSGKYILRIKNVTVAGTKGGYMYLFGSDRSSGTGTNGALISLFNEAYDESTGVYTFDLSNTDGMGMYNSSYYVRLSIGNINENTIITWNEEIAEGGSTIVKEWKWVSTGHAFIPANYEPRIIAVEEKAASNTARIVALESNDTSSSAGLTESQKLAKIREWDKPVYDPAPVTLITDDRVKPALTTDDRTIEAIYAKYRALMAEHPQYITETNMGKSASSDTFAAVDMLRFDFKEPDGLTQPDLGESALHETKPTIIFMSGVHTEWVGVWGLYYALEEITTNPAFDDVRRNAHIVVIPCANPFCLSKQTVEGWTTSHVNANGVAIHNNFGVDHSTSGSVGAYNYGGTAPYSEPETQYIDAVMAEYPDAVAFVSCHNNDYSTYYGSHVIWASSATYHMCNLAFRLVDKMTKAWLDKYGDTLKTAIDNYKVNMDADDYRLGRATMSTSKGTEQKNATKYGIQGVNLEISRMMKVFSGNTDGTSEVMTHGAEVYANFMRTLLRAYDINDKENYYK